MSHNRVPPPPMPLAPRGVRRARGSGVCAGSRSFRPSNFSAGTLG